MIGKLLSSFSNYMQEGSMWQLGYSPVESPAVGMQQWELFGVHGMEKQVGSTGRYGMMDSAGIKALPAQGWGAKGMGALSIGLTGIFLAQGYHEDGWRGVWDAYVQDVSASAAASRFGYARATAKGGIKSRGWGRGPGTAALFGGIGASIGQGIAGTPGALAGGYIGGALSGRAAWASIPIAATGAAVGYGTYQILKAGYRHAQTKKGIQTSGDLSAFMTQNAMTMRARAVQAIGRSHTNSRTALGQEASLLHSPQRNYFSQYRGA